MLALNVKLLCNFVIGFGNICFFPSLNAYFLFFTFFFSISQFYLSKLEFLFLINLLFFTLKKLFKKIRFCFIMDSEALLMWVFFFIVLYNYLLKTLSNFFRQLYCLCKLYVKIFICKTYMEFCFCYYSISVFGINTMYLAKLY